LPADLARYFRAVHSIHISAEESAVHLMAARWLEPLDRETLARRMLARRTVTQGSRR
jgi:hypothetical protein